MFQNAKHVVMTKEDLLRHVPFDLDLAVRNALQVNPALEFFHVSALTGKGLGEWFDFLRQSVRPLTAA
jgi:hydrogenase nickel incorporation protein HypB